MPLRPKAKFEVTADDKTAAGLLKAQKNTERFAKRTSSLLSKAFAGVGIGLLTRQIIANTRKQEEALRQLEAAIESTGGVAGFTSGQLAQMAKDLQSLTTFGDEAVIQMQSILLTFTRIRGPEFQRTTQAILDVATRMGTTLSGAAVQLGKALNDPVANLGELGRAGIQFSKDQKAVIKALVETGRLAEAQGIILGELETQFGGASVAARDTFGGAIDSLKNAFGDLLEGGGGNLDEATDALNEFTEILQDPETVKAFETLTSAVLKLLTFTAGMAQGFANAGTAIGESVAAFGAGIPIGEAADRIAEIRAELEKLEKIGVAVHSQRPTQLRAELAELEAMQKLHEELIRGREAQAAAIASDTVDAKKEELDIVVQTTDELKKQKQIQEAINASLRREAEAQPDFVGPALLAPIRTAAGRVPLSGDPDMGPQATPEQRAAAEEFQRELREASDEMSIFARRAFENIQDASASFFESAIRGFHDLDSVGQSALNSLISTLAQSLSKSFLEGLFGGDGFLGGLFGGFRQHGGPVAAGVPYLVGERGPELFIPGRSGQVVAEAVGGVVINNTINVNGAEPERTAELLQPVLEQNRRATIAEIARLRVKGRWPP